MAPQLHSKNRKISNKWKCTRNILPILPDIPLTLLFFKKFNLEDCARVALEISIIKSEVFQRQTMELGSETKQIFLSFTQNWVDVPRCHSFDAALLQQALSAAHIEGQPLFSPKFQGKPPFLEYDFGQW